MQVLRVESARLLTLNSSPNTMLLWICWVGRSRLERLKQQGEQLGSEVEGFKQQGEQCGSEVERLRQQGEKLASEFERLKELVATRSSFRPTGNRAMPAWGNSSYSRCQLPFSWTELNKGYKEREILFRTGGLGRHMQENVYESWVCVRDHFCGDPVFCWVYHENDKVFTPWGPNSELLLVTGL